MSRDGIDADLAREAKACQKSKWLTPDLQHWYFFALYRLVPSTYLDVRILPTFDVRLRNPQTGRKVTVPLGVFADRDLERAHSRVRGYLDKLTTRKQGAATTSSPPEPERPKPRRKRPPIQRRRPGA